MSDDADRANDVADFYVSVALKNIEINAGKESAAECEECGNLIPVARQLAVPGCSLCVECQRQLEVNESRFR